MESIALVMPQPGQGTPVKALKGQKNGIVPPILSADKTPVICKMAMERKMPATTRAILRGMRQRSISVLEKFIDLMLLDSIGDYMKPEEGKHKREYRQIVR